MKKLSVLIPFKNEREEVALTCKSVRDTAGDNVDIIVLNDDSDKDYDYRADLAPYDVDYSESAERLGSSMGKQWLTEKCKTPYFMLLDAHCRLYTEDWLEKALSVLERDEDCVYCCAVQYFTSEADHRDPKHTVAYGGWFDYKPETLFLSAWNTKKMSETEFDVPSILGANYLCSKRWWDYLGGFKGLKLYGREESFISKKSWLAGGKVRCIPQILTGHKAREGSRQPYRCCIYENLHNEMAQTYIMLAPAERRRLTMAWQRTQHPYVMRKALNLLKSHAEELDALREDFQGKVQFTHAEVDAINTEFVKRLRS